MNIFYLSYNPKKCAQQQFDSHVVKMTLETAQMLSTAHRVLDGIPTQIKKKTKFSILLVLPNEIVQQNEIINPKVYKTTHVNHPCSVWIRQSTENYAWAYQLMIELDRERQFRYGTPQSKTITNLGKFLKQFPKNLKIGKMSTPPQAMDVQYQHVDVIQAYRQCYVYAKPHLAKWTNRSKPSWYPPELVNVKPT